jgi:hypothetical protein
VVGVVSGAGASMTIKGSLDTSNIESGFSRVKSGLEGVKGQSKSFSSDLERMQIVGGRLVKTLGAMAIAGATAMVGIASKAPAVAPALAKMGVEFDRLSRVLGKALQPAFERVGEVFSKFVGWVDDNSESITYLADNVLSGLETALSGVKTVWDGLVSSTDKITKSVGIDMDLGGPLVQLITAGGAAAVLGKLLGINPAVMGSVGALAYGVGVAGKDDSTSGERVIGGAALGGGAAGLGAMIAGAPVLPWLLGGAAVMGTVGLIAENSEFRGNFLELPLHWSNRFFRGMSNDDDRRSQILYSRGPTII